ncbi:uncharacterized protein LOC117784772 [Drosophila innubila]|uniref:uncharacterized protein LOC117784772 n=1 Tax=Drosophila innubila TaxID=198719 RepID=UPI00148BBF4E|nr:uncharacterized protein LOC117784772 [Drosophila innubila]
MSLVFKNEFQWLATVILPDILRIGRLVDNFNESLVETFKVGSIEINIIGPEEAYMLTLCYRATVNFEYAGEKLQKKLIVKRTPKISQEIYKSLQFHYLFNNEIRFYTEILPIIQNLSHGSFAAPKYYYSEMSPTSAVLILGDFGADGWSVTKKRFGLSLEHARIAVKYLGRFHGLGYALKHNQKDLFDNITSKLKEARFGITSLTSHWELSQKAAILRAGKAVSTYQPQVDKDFVRKFQQLTYSYLGYGRQRVAPREPLSTLCHGDYLRNNVAYKYDTDSSGNPLDIMMFDYQTMRLSSPMIDLSIFLALSLLADVRYKNFDSLFDDYCNALFESYGEYSNQALPDFLNRENLLKEYIRFLPYAVFIKCFFLMALVDPPSTSPEENLTKEKSEEEIIQTAYSQGGELVDREIAHQIMEMFELSCLHNVQIDEDIDTTEWINNTLHF